MISRNNAVASQTLHPGRYRVVLRVNGREVLTGWWDDPDVADAKCGSYIEEFKDQAGAAVRLTEADDSGREWELHSWPPSAVSRA
ncbi:hypothetical protein [Streptomyces nigra]|uniref:hypothetical protein n=1 Tax=Streptomyces nigra TaxID=1827580 RepID=UPI00381800F3